MRNPRSQEPEAVADRPVTLEDLTRAGHAEPTADPGELAADIFESDAELEAFLAGLRASAASGNVCPGDDAAEPLTVTVACAGRRAGGLELAPGDDNPVP